MSRIPVSYALNTLTTALMSSESHEASVGGQAIIEGVMMRSKENVSWAVQTPSGEVVVERHPFTSLSKKIKLLGKPVFRGAVSLVESLQLGFRALSRSAELSVEEQQDEKKQKSWKDSAGNVLSIGIALIISFGLFLYLPLKILSFFVPQESALLYNLLAGGIRMVFFLMYLMFISMMKDIRRVFEFHGAEHKAIFAYEDGKDLTIENMKPYTTFHPRCGTSFLLLVALICVGIFAVIDGLLIHFVGPYPNTIVRTLVHIAFIPVVSGTSFEILKLTDRYRRVGPVRMLVQPGLWLQRITTKEPDESQMKVASQALEAAL
ncbi:MAG: DUF1385 domain-containing protein [Chitinivibrionales bacterium]